MHQLKSSDESVLTYYSRQNVVSQNFTYKTFFNKLKVKYVGSKTTKKKHQRKVN